MESSISITDWHTSLYLVFRDITPSNFLTWTLLFRDIGMLKHWLVMMLGRILRWFPWPLPPGILLVIISYEAKVYCKCS